MYKGVNTVPLYLIHRRCQKRKAGVPPIQLQLHFWDADEDFPAQTQILVDRKITDYIHFETVGCLISDLLEKLEQSV